MNTLLSILFILFFGVSIGIWIFFVFLLPFKYAIVGVFAVLAPFFALFIGNWKYFFLTFFVLGIPIQVKKTLYGYSLDHIGGPGGIDVVLADFAMLGLYAHWFFTSIFQKSKQVVLLSRFDCLLLAFVLINGLSLLNADDLTLGMIGFIRLVKVGLIYFYISHNIQKTKDFKWVLVVLLLGVLIQGSMSIAQYLLKRPIGLTFLGEVSEFSIRDHGGSKIMRPSGMMQGANSSALYMVMMLPLSFASLFWLKGRAMKILGLIIFFIGLFTLVITYSRGGWVGFLFSFPILLYLYFKKGFISYKKHYHFFLLISFVSMTALLYLSPKIIDRLFNTPSIPIYTRSFLNQTALNLIGSHPIMGVGINNFEESAHGVIREIPDPHHIFRYIKDNPIVHNLYLLVSAELGLLGLIIFLIFIYALLKKSWRYLYSDDPLISCLGIAFFCCFLGFMVTENFDFSYRLDQIYYLFWTLAALVVALSHLEGQSESKMVRNKTNATRSFHRL